MTISIKADLVAPASGRNLAWQRKFKGDNLAGLQAGGAFEQWAAENIVIAAIAVTDGIKAGTEGLKTDLRRAVIEGGLGEKLPNAIRSEVYPKNKASLDAAGWIFTKGVRTRQILEAYAGGAIIRGKGKRFLAIPTEAGKGLVKARGGAGFLSSSYGLGIPTRVVVPPKGAAKRGVLWIVADLRKGRGKRGGYRKPTAAAVKRRDVEEVVLFILVPQVEVKRRINIDGLAEQWAARVPGLIERALPDL